MTALQRNAARVKLTRQLLTAAHMWLVSEGGETLHIRGWRRHHGFERIQDGHRREQTELNARNADQRSQPNSLRATSDNNPQERALGDAAASGQLREADVQGVAQALTLPRESTTKPMDCSGRSRPTQASTPTNRAIRFERMRVLTNRAWA